MYFKKVVYLDLIHKSPGGWELKEPEKLGSAGFAKLEICDGKLHLSITLRIVQTFLPEGSKQISLELTDGSVYVLGNAEYQKGMLSFTQQGCRGVPGSVEGQKRVPPDGEKGEEEKNSWKPEQLWGIHIALTPDYEVWGQLPGVGGRAEAKAPSKPVPQETEEPHKPVPQETEETQEPQKPVLQATEETQEPQKPVLQAAEETQEPQKPKLQTAEKMQKPRPQAEKVTPKPRPQEIEQEITAGKSKWEMLLEQYTLVHPFQDERIYLSITPDDFLILSEGDYRLRSNRFLLHGYYNYKHILLGKMPDSTGKEEYYVGVPGLFYEQEKKMAILFGFEGFESRTSRPTDGTFGYYMTRVNL